MKVKGGQAMVKLIVGNKVYMVSEKMADATISLAINKYLGQNINAIVALKKGDMVVLKKDVYDDTESLDKAIKEWEHGGYECYHSKKIIKVNGGK